MIRFMSKCTDEHAVPRELENYPIPPKLLQLLCQRGINTKESIDRYLNPEREDLHDPMQLSDMGKAVDVIRDALKKQESITVFGDYDVDGVTATAILLSYLRSLGGKVDYYIPDRHGEGYGLNKEAVAKIAEHSRLLITVDCGITCMEEVAFARSLGMRVIVTDHHQIGEQIPVCEAVINPLLANYPFRRLCGAGVAFKIVQALGGMEAIKPYWDLAALATIADIVPLIDENRVIVTYGLQDMALNRRPGLMALMRSASLDEKEPNSSDIAFRIAPRINAGGRLALASRSVELLTTADEGEAACIAEELNGDNEKRRELELRISQEAETKALSEIDFLHDRIILVCGKGWNTGVIGLAAARLVEKYRWPCILLSEDENGICVGSARSIPGVDIYKSLAACGPIFERFGGHAQAAGLTIRKEKFAALKERLNQIIRERAEKDAFIPTEEYDLEIDLSDISEDFVNAFSRMQPTGFGNPQAVFCLKGVRTADIRRIGKEGFHLRMSLVQNNQKCPAIAFRMGAEADRVPTSIEAIVGLSVNEWQGHRTVQCEMKKFQAYQPGKAFADQCSAHPDEIESSALKDFLLNGRTETLPEIRKMTLAEAEKNLVPLVSLRNQGTIVCVHSTEALGMINVRLAVMRARTDYAVGYPTDIRCFNTLVVAPDWEKIDCRYENIIMADGFVSEEERSAVISKFGAGSVIEITGMQRHRMKLAEQLLPDDGELRDIYKSLRTQEGRGCTVSMLAHDLGVKNCHVLCAVRIFEELDLLTVNDSFQYKLVPGKKVSLDSSRIRGRLIACKMNEGGGLNDA